jgi:hypothetical protein
MGKEPSDICIIMSDTCCHRQGMLAFFRCRIFVFWFAIQKLKNIKIYSTKILLAVLYGCETSPTLKEKRRLRVFENRGLRRIFGSKRDEVTRE